MLIKNKKLNFMNIKILKSLVLVTPFLLVGCNDSGGKSDGNDNGNNHSQIDNGNNNNNNGNGGNNGSNPTPSPKPTPKQPEIKENLYGKIYHTDYFDIMADRKYEYESLFNNSKSNGVENILLETTEVRNLNNDLNINISSDEDETNRDLTSKINKTKEEDIIAKGAKIYTIKDLEKKYGGVFADKIKDLIDKNVEEKDSFYLKSMAFGQLSKKEVEKSLFKENLSNNFYVGLTRDFISKGDKEKESLLVFNSGLKDTSNKWTKDTVEKAFRWNRLERDRIVDLKTDSAYLIADPEKFDYLVRDDLAKVMVLDTSYLKTYDLDYDRVEDTHYVFDGEGEEKIKDVSNLNANHGDSVLYAMMGRNYDKNKSFNYLENTYSVAWHEKGAQYFYPGFLTNKGKVAFIGQRKNENKGVYIDDALESPKVKELIDKGYKFVNGSFSYSGDIKGVYENNPVRKNETYLEHLKRVDWNDDRTANHFYDLVKQDVLVGLALGNEYDKTVSLTIASAYMMSDKLKSEETLKGMMAIGAYDPTTKQKAKYSNSCGDFKDICLIAPGQYFAKYNEEYAKKFNLKPSEAFFAGYTTGTSLATPYTMSTAAMVKSVFPWMTNYNIQQTLLTTAKDLGEKGVDKVYGWGLIQPQKAVNGPAKFYNEDFVADLNHASHYNYLDKNQIFRFSNDIEGSKGLTVLGNYKNSILSLSGKNSYTGDTILRNRANLNIDGVNVASKTVIESGHLYGSGWLGHVYNNDNLHNYSYFRNMNTNELRTKHGMVIEGDYKQTDKGILNVYLGTPLLVKGYADLGGTLNVEGIDVGYITKYGKIFEDVLVSQKGISGKFDQLITPTSLLVPELTYNTLNLGEGKRLYTVSLFADYVASPLLDKRMKKILTSFSDKEFTYKVKANDNFKNINSKIDHLVDFYVNSTSTNQVLSKIEKAKKATKYIKDLNSGIIKFIGKVQNSQNHLEVVKALEQFSGKEFTQNHDNVKAINSLNQFNTIFKDDENNVSYKFNRIKNGNINTLNIANDNLGLSITKGSIKQKSFDDKTNVLNHTGLNVNAKHVVDDIEIGALFGFEKNKNKLNRSTDLFGVSYKLNDQNYKENSLYGMLTFGHKFNFTNKQDIKPFIGYSYEISNISKYNESYNDFNLELNNQKLKDHFGLMGFKYNYEPIENLTLNLNYFYKHQLNKNNELKGKLYDNALNEEITFINTNKNEHIIDLSINKIWDNFNIGLNASYHKVNKITKDQKDDFVYGIKVGYKF